MTDLERTLGYFFNDQKLLNQALTTPAYAKQNEVESYERLEFLGDAVAKLIIGDELFKEQSWEPEALTKYRSVLESNMVFSQQA
ncbi:MAG: ribonuclease III domain-containing protein, partial [Candidatus Hodarchaeota archaeon]